MGRRKLETTGPNPRNISVRWRDDYHMAYLRLGGSSWLRDVVGREIERHGGAHLIPRRSERDQTAREGSAQ